RGERLGVETHGGGGAVLLVAAEVGQLDGRGGPRGAGGFFPRVRRGGGPPRARARPPSPPGPEGAGARAARAPARDPSAPRPALRGTSPGGGGIPPGCSGLPRTGGPG